MMAKLNWVALRRCYWVWLFARETRIVSRWKFFLPFEKSSFLIWKKKKLVLFFLPNEVFNLNKLVSQKVNWVSFFFTNKIYNKSWLRKSVFVTRDASFSHVIHRDPKQFNFFFPPSSDKFNWTSCIRTTRESLKNSSNRAEDALLIWVAAAVGAWLLLYSLLVAPISIHVFVVDIFHNNCWLLNRLWT